MNWKEQDMLHFWKAKCLVNLVSGIKKKKKLDKTYVVHLS